MATDVPFWRKSTGAEQRMASLVHFLSIDGFQVRTFFLGQTDTDQFTSMDRELISSQNLDIEQRSSEQPPQQLASKIGWYAQAAQHQWSQWARGSDGSDSNQGNSDGSDSVDSPDEETPSLGDYRWPWAISAFAESIAKFKPNSVIIQYVKLSYLLEAIDQEKSEVMSLIDTHDVLHVRAKQFREHGFKHWIELSKEEEANELKKFDTIIAIQDKEAELFRELVPDTKTIVCGHSVELAASTRPVALASTSPTSVEEDGPAKLTIGYLGSANASNTHAVESFLSNVWPELVDLNPEMRFDLVIAGGICQWLVQSDVFETLDENRIDLLGSIADLETFYNRVDVVINPVQFGTGLKIKNCEAIAFGKPVLTTPAGNAGFPAAAQSAIVVCDSAEAFQIHLISIAVERERLTALQAAATKLSQSGFSDQHVYSALKKTLLEGF